MTDNTLRPQDFVADNMGMPTSTELIPTPNLYLVEYDGERYYVEAVDFPSAISTWLGYMAMVWGNDFKGNEQPDSVAFIHDEPVIRS